MFVYVTPPNAFSSQERMFVSFSVRKCIKQKQGHVYAFKSI